MEDWMLEPSTGDATARISSPMIREKKNRPSSLLSVPRNTLSPLLSVLSEPLANQPPLTQAYIFRGTPAQVAPTPGARPILSSCRRDDADPRGPPPYRSLSPPLPSSPPVTLCQRGPPSSRRPARKKETLVRTTGVDVCIIPSLLPYRGCM